MDESWRMRIGMETLPRRKSMTDGSTRHSFTSTLDPDDFSDVFGGPPRTLLSRKFSADFLTSSSSSSHFYSEVFRTSSSDFVSPPKMSGRILPAFKIPTKNEGLYGDVFMANDGRKSRERSCTKSNSSSVLSSEELSPLRPVDGDDVALSSFASKLRPINVPYRWNSTTMMPVLDDQPNNQTLPAFQCNRVQNHYMAETDNNDSFTNSYYGFSRRVSSPETMTVEPTSYRSIKLSVDDLELNNSPSSPASSLCQEPERKTFMQCSNNNTMQEQELELEDESDDDDDDEVMSSYVIEINSDHREGNSNSEAVSIDEAIAWAKEKFQTQSSSVQHDKDPSVTAAPEMPNANECLDRETEEHRTGNSPMDQQNNWRTEEVKEQSEDMEMEILEEDIRLWSAGKETNIRSLLSTLHHVLWPSSGWYPVSLMSLIESSNVKKAYQKARLCLHPDKLQQRGATIQQKRVAEQVFSILQDAWSAFISEDVFF